MQLLWLLPQQRQLQTASGYARLIFHEMKWEVTKFFQSFDSPASTSGPAKKSSDSLRISSKAEGGVCASLGAQLSGRQTKHHSPPFPSTPFPPPLSDREWCPRLRTAQCPKTAHSLTHSHSTAPAANSLPSGATASFLLQTRPFAHSDFFNRWTAIGIRP